MKFSGCIVCSSIPDLHTMFLLLLLLLQPLFHRRTKECLIRFIYYLGFECTIGSHLCVVFTIQDLLRFQLNKIAILQRVTWLCLFYRCYAMLIFRTQNTEVCTRMLESNKCSSHRIGYIKQVIQNVGVTEIEISRLSLLSASVRYYFSKINEN